MTDEIKKVLPDKNLDIGKIVERFIRLQQQCAMHFHSQAGWSFGTVSHYLKGFIQREQGKHNIERMAEIVPNNNDQVLNSMLTNAHWSTNQKLLKIGLTLLLGTFISSAPAVKLRQKIDFKKSCEPGRQFVVSAVGDVLLHSGLQKKAAADKDFRGLWKDFIPYFQNADQAYANLEGAAAKGVNQYGKNVRDPGHVWDKYVYTAYPQFNYHPSLIKDLKDSGIDVVSTANNHSLDRRSLGVDRTIDALTRTRLPFTGTRKSDETEADRKWFTVVRSKNGGLTLTWIACTYGTNGIPDRRRQVLHCFKPDDKKTIINIIQRQKDQTDAVIVTPHWGKEYQTYPHSSQVKLGKEFLEAGAIAVIGSHPHVLQPMEKYVTQDKKRETFIIYSLGNFVSNQRQLKRRATIVLFLGFTKTADGSVHLNGVKFLPAYMNNRSGRARLSLKPIKEGWSYGRAGLTHILKVFSKEHMVYFDNNRYKKVVTNSHCNNYIHKPKLRQSPDHRGPIHLKKGHWSRQM